MNKSKVQKPSPAPTQIVALTPLVAGRSDLYDKVLDAKVIITLGSGTAHAYMQLDGHTYLLGSTYEHHVHNLTNPDSTTDRQRIAFSKISGIPIKQIREQVKQTQLRDKERQRKEDEQAFLRWARKNKYRVEKV